MSLRTETPRFLPESERSKYITLKEAAEITHYSPDYIGQLIRAGKIEGQQVYTSVSWVTTEEAVRAYMPSKNKVEEAAAAVPFWQDPQWYIRYALYMVIVGLSGILVLLCYIFFVGIDRTVTNVSMDYFSSYENKTP